MIIIERNTNKIHKCKENEQGYNDNNDNNNNYKSTY